MIGIFRKTLGGFEPIDENAKKIHRRCKSGDDIEFIHKHRRGIKFHRKFFALINLTFQNQDITDSPEDFREAVTISAGFYRYQRQIDGTEVKRANSISFAKMDDIVFADVYSRVLTVCVKLLGCKSEELEMELMNFA